MVAMVIAYLIVWLAVVLYVAGLDARGRRLARALETLRLQLEQSRGAQQPTSAAA